MIRFLKDGVLALIIFICAILSYLLLRPLAVFVSLLEYVEAKVKREHNSIS